MDQRQLDEHTQRELDTLRLESARRRIRAAHQRWQDAVDRMMAAQAERDKEPEDRKFLG